MKKVFLVSVVLLLLLTGCQQSGKEAKASDFSEKATYTLTLSGALEEAGYISYAGYEMNVYEDQASNPCGDCELQPVSVLKGADAKEVAQAIVNAVEKQDTTWDVKESTDTTVTLIEKKAGDTTEPEAPEAPAGLTITGEYTPAK